MKVINEGSVDIVFALIDTINKNKDFLSEIDGAIGDGDHGVNMSKGFTMAGQRLISDGVTSLSRGLLTLGDVLMMDIGGSMGPLYGTIFTSMGEALDSMDLIHEQAFAEMLNHTRKELREISDAKVGDKTLWDTLEPAIEDYLEALNEKKSFSEAMGALKSGAERGWQSTKDMEAKIGRASRLGERSKGHLDAGATSCNLILNCLADGMIRKMSEI